MNKATDLLILIMGIVLLEPASWGQDSFDALLSREPEPARSSYSKILQDLSQHWEARKFETDKNLPILIRRFQSSDNPFAIGLEATMVINAPFERVEKALDQKEFYSELFPSFSHIQVISQDEKETATYWERSVPFPFVPNVKYILVTKKEIIRDRRIYSTHLRYGNYLKYNDAILVIEKDISDPSKTLYTEFSFYNADWGIAQSIFPDKIWRGNIEGFVNSDITLKLRAEHPEWSFEALQEQQKKLTSAIDIDLILASHEDPIKFFAEVSVPPSESTPQKLDTSNSVSLATSGQLTEENLKAVKSQTSR